jgi:predicted TPR repeat methyltransferase
MNGSFEEAVFAYGKGVDHLLEKDSLIVAISLYTNLGTAQYTIGRLDDAAASYRTALLRYAAHKGESRREKADLDSISASASFYLGMVCQDQKLAQDAIDAYKLAHSLDPHHWSALANLGSVYQELLMRFEDALSAYNQAYTLLVNSDNITLIDAPIEPRFILSQLQYRIGVCIQHFIGSGRSCVVQGEANKAVDCKELATHAFSSALGYDMDNESARHMLATLTADGEMKRASNKYVKSLFDDYASNFEHSLVQELGYTGYARLRSGFDRAFSGQPPIFERVVDAGCGTGLAGEQFRNISSHLSGVDLSQAIIDQALAVRPNLYNDTVAGDLIDIFRERSPISLIIAADSFIYFGDLAPLFEAMNDGLEEEAYAAFTLENVSVDDEKQLRKSTPDWRWQLTPSGRFAHRKAYVEYVSRSNGLRVVHYEELLNFRHERGSAVNGHIFVVQKTVDDKDEL